jgi:hypothetical protein
MEPGPVKHNPNAIPARARLVREAFMEVARDELDLRAVAGLEVAAELCSDDTLARLGRLLK